MGRPAFLSLGFRNLEAHPDGGRGMLLVLDFRFGQSRLKGNRPIDGLLASVDETVLHEAGEGPENVGFVGGGLRLVLILPVRENAQALELRRLCCDPGFGKFVAQFAAVPRSIPAVSSAGGSRVTFCSIGRPWQSHPGT